MTRIDFRSVLVAIAFVALGFLAAERMGAAHAAPAQAGSANDVGSFAGTNGAITVFDGKQWWVVVVRDERIYKVPLADRQSPSRPWSELANQ